ncbi:MAG: hypothetical protein KDJ73_07325 [Notoacmeibacter sp.]|nr:hypothetical protein [Notoacmeibacter sp.]MCC0032018.1 hypothetical protein [Brucellaceae bacterium]
MENIHKTYLALFFSIIAATCTLLIGIYCKLEILDNIWISFLVFMAVLIIEIRIQIEKIDITALQSRKIQRVIETDPKISELFEFIADQYCISESKKYHPFDRYVEDARTAFVGAIRDCYAGQITVEPRGLHTFGTDGIRRTRETIRAVTAASVEDYWNSDWGRHYLDAQREILARGVRISRIFLVSDAGDLAKKSAMMQAQSELGIEVFVLNLEKAKAVRIAPRDFLIQDDIVGVEVRLDGNGIETIETINFNNNAVNELKSTFGLYMKCSSRFS